MAGNIQVVLREDVEHVGNSGEIVKVKPGFARNYLIPRGLAAAATRGNVKQVEHERRLAVARAAKANADAEAEAAKLSGVAVKIAKAAGDEGKLYGSVTSQEVAAALKESTGVEVDRRKIKLPKEAIKAVGHYAASVKLTGSVSAHFAIEVTAE